MKEFYRQTRRLAVQPLLNQNNPQKGIERTTSGVLDLHTLQVLNQNNPQKGIESGKSDKGVPSDHKSR